MTTETQMFDVPHGLDSDELNTHIENIKFKGYTIVNNALSAEECSLISKKLDCLNQEQIERYSASRLHELKDYGVIRGMAAEDDYFCRLALHPKVLSIVEKVIGTTAIVHVQNGIVVEPNEEHCQAVFHRDFAKDFVADKVLFLGALFAIDDFSEETGGTVVVPGTHLTTNRPSEKYLEQNVVQIEAKKGSVFIFDGLLLHKAGANRSEKPRRALNQGYTRPFVKQQMDYVHLLKGKLDPDSRLAQIWGLWSVPPKSADEYRVDPSERSYRKGQG